MKKILICFFIVVVLGTTAFAEDNDSSYVYFDLDINGILYKYWGFKSESSLDVNLPYFLLEEGYYSYEIPEMVSFLKRLNFTKNIGLDTNLSLIMKENALEYTVTATSTEINDTYLITINKYVKETDSFYIKIMEVGY